MGVEVPALEVHQFEGKEITSGRLGGEAACDDGDDVMQWNAGEIIR